MKKHEIAPSATLVSSRQRIVIQRHFLINFLQHIFEVIYITTLLPAWVIFFFILNNNRVIFTLRNYDVLVLSVKYFDKTSLPTDRTFFTAHNEPSVFQLQFWDKFAFKAKFLANRTLWITSSWPYKTLKQDQDVLTLNKGHRNHPISFLSKEAITG